MGRHCEQSEYCLASLGAWVTFLEARHAQAARLLLFPVVGVMVGYQHNPLPHLRSSPPESVLAAVFPLDSE